MDTINTDMGMNMTRGYIRNCDGELQFANILCCGDQYYIGGWLLTSTDEIVSLEGWPDQQARLYKAEGGVEVLIPEGVRTSMIIHEDTPYYVDVSSCVETVTVGPCVIVRRQKGGKIDQIADGYWDGYALICVDDCLAEDLRYAAEEAIVKLLSK